MLKINSQRPVQILVAIATVAAAIVTVLNYYGYEDQLKQEFASQRFNAISFETMAIQFEILEEKFEDYRNTQSLLSTEVTAGIELTKQLKELNQKILKVDDSTTALRQAINPLKPDEVLTIARLTDEVKSINLSMSDLEDRLKDKHIEFSRSVIRELESAKNSTNVILIILLPLLLNFFYTIWKDYKDNGNNNNLANSRKDNGTESTESDK